jgi:hypothetical protein
VVAHFRCRPSPVTGVSFTKHTTRTVFVRCYKLESLCAGARSNGARVRVLTARLTFGCGPFAVSKGKRQSVAEHAQVDEPKAAGGTRVLHSACLRRTGDSRIVSRSVHSLLAPGHVLADYTGPKVSCGSCCVVLYWYTSCSSSNLPSSEYAGQDHSVKSGRPSSVGMCDPNSKVFSLIDPNQPRCAEFFRGGETPEPLHPDHIRVKRPVCPQVFF